VVLSDHDFETLKFFLFFELYFAPCSGVGCLGTGSLLVRRRCPNLFLFEAGIPSARRAIEEDNGLHTMTGGFFLNGKFHLTTNWQGTTINGTVSRDGNRINWDNWTYWIRYRLYTQ
jgi:hypothetical protein